MTVNGDADVTQAKHQVAAYYFPNYHADPRNEQVHGQGWTEWELVKAARPRFLNHQQPRVPLWGYEDEADPNVFARKIDAAADHAVDAFIFDWYWYNDGPFLQRGLEEGFLRAANNHRLKFSLMWANHDWLDIHPYTLGASHKVLYPGAVTQRTFDTVAEYVIERYFKHPSYWKIDGCPYFSIYELFRLIQSLGGLEQTRISLDSLRRKTQAAGFPDLHLNAVAWGVQILPGETMVTNPNDLLTALGFSSVTTYVWVHHTSPNAFPATDYAYYTDETQKYWRNARSEFALPYFPNVTVGWDSSPRARQSDPYEDEGYPFMSVIANNTPAAFKAALARAKSFLDEQPAGRILTLNAWNEWTEGSYLEPDTMNGMAYLEAIRDVFSR